MHPPLTRTDRSASALLKLLFKESESETLARWIAERTDTPLVSCELANVEVVRATRRLDPDVGPAARALVSQLDLIPINGALIERAADTGDPMLPTPDAIHLASALSIRDELTAFVAYDHHRLLAAAAAAGVEPIRPSDASSR